jgi:hypothetical protein
MDDEKGVAPVMLTGEKGLDLLGVDVMVKVPDLGFQIAQDVRVPLVEEFEEDLYLLEAGVDLFPVVELREEGIAFPEDVRGFLAVVVETRLAQFLLEGGETFFPGSEVKDAS